ncbi:MAG: SAM-dependent methyltransferase [Candidatus Dactylopiibacterium carminicum]|uniref:SAM-dependent methyltransferase n=1 Tax=Candidatus Dactylopiibacterium carminicum TaxID=857335 RepID=A0A272EV38_9RHOO|nr:class I SAM-dependent methyltransferase [Candidatus Dactylopiibacterium carminicum]KAF7599851.1 SAM-dependent methyltransferase [Candidatus Dactylopiibacterium carminicum]PAS93962.1 MAG: SAM-dependent methyltransferase [Candidatus Dactylopiibacterium carminicum]PAS99851.1 MAG: hypothetical protein BSR46_05905 [Candidatus Dactylopiibacterium carminicum]
MANSAHTDGYHTGTPYPAFFHRELTPAWLVATATALGHRTAGLDNVHFQQRSFAELAEAEEDALPALDFIVLHGVLSWISPDNRRAVMRIIERWLKPGGIACLAYMSQPGSAPMMAMQRVLRRSAEIAGATPGLASGLDLLRGLRDGGAGQFVVVPELGQQLDQVMRQPPSYLAHEFLGEHWEPLHVADVIAAAADVGCTYVGSATPLENIDAVSLPGGAQAVIGTIADTALRETAKDIARNQTLRRDIHQRDAKPLTPAEHRAALLVQRFIALPGAPAGGALRFNTRIGPVDGAAEVFSPLLQALSTRRPAAFSQLLTLPAYAGRGGLLNQACQILLWAGHLHPCLPGPDAAPAQALNRALWRAAAEGRDYGWVAAPAIGSALPASRAAMLAAHALDSDPALRGAALLAAVRVLDAEITDANALAAFESDTWPAWQRLGAVPQAA